MGNAIIYPPVSDWYVEPLRKKGLTISNPIDSGTFFMTFRGSNANDDVFIIKAYQYNQPLERIPFVVDALEMTKTLSLNMNSLIGLQSYTTADIEDASAYLTRPFFERSLVQCVSEAQTRHPVEFKYMAYQLAKTVQSMQHVRAFHGAIKPNNVFITNRGRTILTDPGTFKPFCISPDHPHTFYHFFTSPSDTNCWLAPERISRNISGNEDTTFMMRADIFSLGVTMMYILIGESIFDFTTLQQYASGGYSIESKLAKIEDDKIRSFVTKCLSLNPEERSAAIAATDRFFPNTFPILYTADLQLERQVVNNEEIFLLIETILGGRSDIDLCLLGSNICADLLYNSPNVEFCSTMIPRLVAFSHQLPTNFKILRLLPIIVAFYASESNILRQTALSSTIEMLKHIDEPFSQEILNVAILGRIQADDEFWQMLIAEFAPSLALQFSRIAPDLTAKVPIVCNFALRTTSLKILHAHLYSLENAVREGGAVILSTFIQFLMANTNSSEDNIIEVLFNSLQSIYKVCPKRDSYAIRHLFTTMVTPVVTDLLTRSSSSNILSCILQTVVWLSDNKLLHRSYQSDVISRCKELLESKDHTVRYLANILMKEYPSDTWCPFNLTVKEFTILKNSSRVATMGNRSTIHIPTPSTPKIDPHFCGSIRPRASTISHIVDFEPGKLVITVDDSNAIRWIEVPEMSVRMAKTTREKVVSIASLSSNIVFSTIDGDLQLLDAALGRKITNYASGGTMQQIVRLGTSTFAASYGGNIAMYDERIPTPVHVIPFDFGPITGGSSWNEALSVWSFEAGALSVFDSRVCAPSMFRTSSRCQQVVALPNTIGTVAISTSNGGEVIDLALNKTWYYYRAPISAMASFTHGVVALDRSCTSYFPYDCGKRPLSLSDGSSMELDVQREGHSIDVYSVPQKIMPSLTKHSAPIKCVTQTGPYFISCDESGFVNMWTVRSFS